MSSKDSRPTIVRRDGALYRLLFDAFTDHRSKQGLLDIPRLAKDIEVRNETVYKALRHDRLSPNSARALLQLAHENHPDNPTIYSEDLSRFVIPDFDQFRRPEEDDALLA